MQELTKQQIADFLAFAHATYEGRKIEEAKDPAHCGTCDFEIHVSQLTDPKSWVHSSVSKWLYAVRQTKCPHCGGTGKILS